MDIQRGDLGVSDHAKTGHVDQAISCAIGELVCAWGNLEHTAEVKLSEMRIAAGDVGPLIGRGRPGLVRLLAELRAFVSMRDRNDRATLQEITDIENGIRRVGQFNDLVIGGFQTAEEEIIRCRDAKNGMHDIALQDVRDVSATLHNLGARLRNL